MFNEDEKFSILVVDDEKSNIDVLNHILKSEYRVLVAKSGEAALKRTHEELPDLILLDVLMPDMSGFEVLTALKESDETRGIPVIIITGLSGVHDEEKGFFLGAVDYITKPFNNSIIRARVKNHIQIVKQIRTIERLGTIDALTDIPNRRSFDNQIFSEWGRAIRDKTPLSLLMIDADDFKSYNDAYGHPQGDVLLQVISRIFSKNLKRATDYAARIGGEEFAVILPDTDLDGALAIAENIRRNVEKAAIPSIRDIPPTLITISIGCACVIPENNDIVTDFIQAADSMLYKAKRAGKNRVCSIKDCE